MPNKQNIPTCLNSEERSIVDHNSIYLRNGNFKTYTVEMMKLVLGSCS